MQFNFESSEFPPESGEDEETNPGIYGKALAAWLSEQLVQRGYLIKRTIAEDFGRLIQLEDPHFQLAAVMLALVTTCRLAMAAGPLPGRTRDEAARPDFRR